jgi:hypothetical protein
MSVQIRSGGRVHAEEVIDLPMPASAVWGQMRDLKRFLTLDPLHIDVRRTDADAPSDCEPTSMRRCSLTIRHRLLGVGVDRRSRVLWWREGRGYAVSDLSTRGVRVGFPHVCKYEVERITPDRSRLRVSATGKWTAVWMPTWMIRAWMWWVMRATRSRIEIELQMVEIMRRRAMRK